jgi:hypothetical protein
VIQELLEECSFYTMPLALEKALQGLGALTDMFGNVIFKHSFLNNRYLFLYKLIHEFGHLVHTISLREEEEAVLNVL